LAIKRVILVAFICHRLRNLSSPFCDSDWPKFRPTSPYTVNRNIRYFPPAPASTWFTFSHFEVGEITFFQNVGNLNDYMVQKKKDNKNSRGHHIASTDGRKYKKWGWSELERCIYVSHRVRNSLLEPLQGLSGKFVYEVMPIIASYKNWVCVPISCTILHFIAYGFSQDVIIARWLSYAYSVCDGDRLLTFIRIRKVKDTITNNSFIKSSWKLSSMKFNPIEIISAPVLSRQNYYPLIQLLPRSLSQIRPAACIYYDGWMKYIRK
jgi:hypothetical protein